MMRDTRNIMRFDNIPDKTSKAVLSGIFEDFDVTIKSIEDDCYDPYNSYGFSPKK